MLAPIELSFLYSCNHLPSFSLETQFSFLPESVALITILWSQRNTRCLSLWHLYFRLTAYSWNAYRERLFPGTYYLLIKILFGSGNRNTDFPPKQWYYSELHVAKVFKNFYCALTLNYSLFLEWGWWGAGEHKAYFSLKGI